MKKIWGEPRVFKGLAVQHHCSPDEPVLAHALSTLTDAKNSRGRASAMLELHASVLTSLVRGLIGMVFQMTCCEERSTLPKAGYSIMRPEDGMPKFKLSPFVTACELMHKPHPTILEQGSTWCKGTITRYDASTSSNYRPQEQHGQGYRHFFFTFTGSDHDYYSKCTDSQLNKIDEDRERLRVRVRVRVSEGWHLQEQQFVLMHELPTDEQWYMPSLATQVNAWE